MKTHAEAKSEAIPRSNRVASAAPVDVSAMLYTQHDNLAVLVVDPVQDPIGATPRRVDAGELAPESRADSSWVLDECSGEELDHCCGHSLWQAALDGSRCWWGKDQLERLPHGSSARAASAPRTMSPS